MTQEEFFKRYTYNTRTDKLGGGAFGTVYKAYDNVLNIYVALKVAEVKTFNGKEFSLKDEFEAIKGLPDHPNIANYNTVYNFEQNNGVYDYALIQYYKDGNLSDLMEKQNLSFPEREDLAIQILQGLYFLHKHKVVHRDMKPSNILIHQHDISGRYIAKIADFGLSKKFDASGKSKMTNSFGGGTLKYSSPEQLKGETIKTNTDLWAWSVMAIELLTGKYPFDVEDVNTSSYHYEQKLYENILKNNLVADINQLPQKWKNALKRCLEKDIDVRCNDVLELFKVLDIKETSYDSLPKAQETKVYPTPKTEIVQIAPAPEKPKATPQSPVTIVETVPKRKNRFWLWALLLPILAGIGFFVYQNLNKEPDKISIEEARTIYEKIHKIQISGDLDKLPEVYTDPLERFLELENPTLSHVISEAKKYGEKWKEEKMQIITFEEVEPNEFRYQITYSVRKLENNKIFDYKISGDVKYRLTDKGYRIYSISESSDRDYMNFTYQNSVFSKTGKSDNGYTLQFDSDILIFNDIKNDLLLDYLYKDIIPGNNFSQWKPTDFFDAQQKQFQNELNDLYSNEAITDSTESYMSSYESSTKMDLKFVDQNFLSVEIFMHSYTGGAHGMQVQLYRNVDIKNNNIVNLSTILDTQNISWNSLLRRCLSNYSKDSEGNSYNESVLFEADKLDKTENFYFDNQNIYLVYQPYEIASYADGIITIKIPFSEVEKWMTEDFKSKIKDSKKVNIKKL